MSSTPKSPSLPKLVTVRSSASVKSLSPRSPVIETSKVVETNDDFETSGRQLNQYQISHTIGGGAFGVVYEAVDLTSNEHVAIKEISKSRLRKKTRGLSNFGDRARRRPSQDPVASLSSNSGEEAPPPRSMFKLQQDDGLANIRMEIAVLKKLDHPNVIRLIEVLNDSQDDMLYMVFELCKNGVSMDLSMETPSQPMKPQQCYSYFLQLFLGIEYLHANNIAHRDLKPDNLLIDHHGCLKISDFGVSEMFESEGGDKFKKSAGSPAFMAPELVSMNTGEMSMRATDIWAMGVTLFSWATGTLPFRGDNIFDLHNSILSSEPDYGAYQLPEDLVDLLKKIFIKDPTNRITLAAIRAHPYLTERGTRTLPTQEDNIKAMIEISDADINNAVSLGMWAKILSKVKQRFRTLSSRTLSLKELSQTLGGISRSGSQNSVNGAKGAVTPSASTPSATDVPSLLLSPQSNQLPTSPLFTSSIPDGM